MMRGMSIHVAILLKRYIRLILEGRKTIESRLTRTARAPYRAIEPGERIYFKASSGPYMATAVADKVVCYDRLTPVDVEKFRNRFNDRVCGDADYWQWKRDSRYATFVLLREVQAMDVGPRMAPSRGLAWFVLPDTAGPAVFDVPLTDGAIRNGYLRIPRKVHAFPQPCYGGATATQAGEPIELLLPDGGTIATDLVGNMLRWRGWREVYRAHDLQPGDAMRFIELSPRRYRAVVVKAL